MVTELGIEIDSSLLQLENASFSMVVTLSGITTDVKFSHLAKASSAMFDFVNLVIIILNILIKCNALTRTINKIALLV